MDKTGEDGKIFMQSHSSLCVQRDYGFVMEECGLVWKSYREHKCSLFGISVVQCEDLVSHLKRAISRVTLYSNHYGISTSEAW